MVNCKICKSVDDYGLKLETINLKNNLSPKTKTLGVGVSVDFPDISRIGNIIDVPININVFAADSKNVDKDNPKNVSEEDIQLKFNCIYTVKLKVNDNISSADDEEIQGYAYFLVEPKINQELSTLGNFVNLPGLKLPKKKSIYNGKSE